MNKLVTVRFVLAVVFFLTAIGIAIWFRLWAEFAMLFFLAWSTNLTNKEKQIRNDK